MLVTAPAIARNSTAAVAYTTPRRRFAHLLARDNKLGGLAVIGRPSRNRSKSSASSCAVEYRSCGNSDKHFSTIV